MVEDIRVLVVVGGPGVAHGLICGLPGDGVSVVGPVADAAAAVEALEREPINLVLVDLDRPDGNGIDIVRQVRGVGDRIRVIGVTAQQGPDLAAGALAVGACGVVSPEPNAESLVSVFHRALAGELILPAIHLSNLVDRLRDGREASAVCRLDFLTGRELEILRAARRWSVDRGDRPFARHPTDDGSEPREEHPGQARRPLEGRGGHARLALRARIRHPQRVTRRG